MLQREAAFAQDRLDHGIGVLVAVFGVNALTALEGNIEVDGGNENRLRCHALQIDFHSRAASVPERNMLEGIKIKVGFELAVQPRQDILIELRGDALGIVVSRQQNLRALGKVGAKQQGIARAQALPDAAQDAYRTVRLEVAD